MINIPELVGWDYGGADLNLIKMYYTTYAKTQENSKSGEKNPIFPSQAR